MKILSIDTSSEACSASINADGELVTEFQLAPQMHSSLILPMCENLLAKTELSLSQIDAIAFGVGPGSFTGLRIAAGVVQGMAFGADLPVIKISTLAALAQQIVLPQAITSEHNTKIIAAIDARMQEMYWCIYAIDENGLVNPAMNETINSPDDIAFDAHLSDNNTTFAIGTGWREFSEKLLPKKFAPEPSNIFADKLASAEEIGVLAASKFRHGETVSAEQAIPVYLRNNVAKKTQKQPQKQP